MSKTAIGRTLDIRYFSAQAIAVARCIGTAALVVLVSVWAAFAEEDAIPDNFDITSTYGPSPSPVTDYGSSTNPDDEGAFRFECHVSHLAYDDPIVFPGQPGVSHLHHFFGNTSANYASTYQSLRTTGGGTCAGGRANRTGYWFPAMIDPVRSKVRIPDFITIYYKTSRGEVSNSVHIPRGLRYIAGYDFANPSVDMSDFFTWGCSDGNTIGRPQTIAAISPACPADQQIFARLDFPRCWDGVNLDSANHRDHMLPIGTDCTIGSRKFIPGITTIIVWYSHDGHTDYDNWYLSSDRFNGANLAGGTSFHSDWFGAWSDTISEKWQDHCDGLGGTQADIRSGTGGQLCNVVETSPNGDGLSWAVLGPAFNESLTLTPLTGSNRWTDIPVNSALRRGRGKGRMR